MVGSTGQRAAMRFYDASHRGNARDSEHLRLKYTCLSISSSRPNSSWVYSSYIRSGNQTYVLHEMQSHLSCISCKNRFVLLLKKLAPEAIWAKPAKTFSTNRFVLLLKKPAKTWWCAHSCVESIIPGDIMACPAYESLQDLAHRKSEHPKQIHPTISVARLPHVILITLRP